MGRSFIYRKKDVTWQQRPQGPLSIGPCTAGISSFILLVFQDTFYLESWREIRNVQNETGLSCVSASIFPLKHMLACTLTCWQASGVNAVVDLRGWRFGSLNLRLHNKEQQTQLAWPSIPLLLTSGQPSREHENMEQTEAEANITHFYQFWDQGLEKSTFASV